MRDLCARVPGLRRLVFGLACVTVCACTAPNTSPSPAAARGQALTHTSLQRVNDSTENIVLENRRDVGLRAWQLTVYDCLAVRQGCGADDPRLVVPPHSTVVLRTVAVVPGVWHFGYEAFWRPAPPPNAASYQLTVSITGPATVLVAPLALAVDGYRPIETGRSMAAWHMVKPSAHLSVWVEEIQKVGSDSLTIELSGARMPTTAAGGVVANEYYWLPLMSDIPANVATLASLGDEVRLAERLASDTPIDTSLARHAAALGLPPPGHLIVAPRDLGDGRWGVCRYSAAPSAATLVVELAAMSDWCARPAEGERLQYNTFVSVFPNAVALGGSVSVCVPYTTRIPWGWDAVEWQHDATRCPADGQEADPNQPNVLVLRRTH